MSLFKFCEAPDGRACPLPPLDARKVRRQDGFDVPGAWPADLLDAPSVAADLATLGVTFQRGTGYAQDGARVTADDVAALALVVLETAADELPWRPREAAAERLRIAREQLEIAERRTLARLDQAYEDGVPDLETASRDVFAMSTYTVRRLARSARQDLETLTPDVGPSWRPYAAALRLTADELRVSESARRRLLSRVQPHLPGPASADPGDVVAFLASLDVRDAVRRSELPALYAAAGSPGGLSPADLRQAAADRWGAPVRLRGIFTYRPSAPATVPALS